MTCTEFVQAAAVCPHCKTRFPVIFQCPIPPAEHGSPMPDALIECPNCGKTGARPEAYWLRVKVP